MEIEYRVDVPEGVSGHWKVEQFRVGEQDSRASAAIALFNHGRGCVSPGMYTRLMCGGRVVMSDTPDEIRDHLGFIQRATGRVLIHGLGLGVVLQAVARKPDVEHVLVVEKSSDVIKLVADHYLDRFPASKLNVVPGDAFTWKPEKGQRWTCAWHDIWSDLCIDNLGEMTKLHRRFGRRCNWQDSWGRSFLLVQRKRYRPNPWR